MRRAGAAVLKKVNQPGSGIIGSDRGADVEMLGLLYTPAGGSPKTTARLRPKTM